MMSAVFTQMMRQAAYGWSIKIVDKINKLICNLRLKAGQQPLHKKGCGCLIHVSDFINEADGHLVEQDDEGKIIQDAQKIIYPGANGDPWWDTDQLLMQVENTIKIFNKTHREAQALFIFNQSSAHDSLPPDALCAFKMNKSNGWAQPFQ